MVSQPLSITDLVFEGRPIRLARNGQLWFVLADVCQALELSNVTETAKRLDQDEFSNTEVTDAAGRRQQMLIVSEPGLYKLIATSRKPVAVRFDRWVRHEVLPSIRKTGTYGSPSLVPPIQIQAISDLFDQKLEPVVHEMRARFKRIDDNVIRLVAKGRKDATVETVRIHGKVIRYHFFKKCPCGECDTTIMDDDGFIQGAWHHHHQFNNSDNRPTAMIPLAIDCHKRIESDAVARTRFGLTAWVHFQTLLDRLPPTQPRLPF
jgi:prophage antirepressor-like protein